MYVPPFVCGIFFTFFVEIALIITVAIVVTICRKRSNRKRK